FFLRRQTGNRFDVLQSDYIAFDDAHLKLKYIRIRLGKLGDRFRKTHRILSAERNRGYAFKLIQCLFQRRAFRSLARKGVLYYAVADSRLAQLIAELL